LSFVFCLQFQKAVLHHSQTHGDTKPDIVMRNYEDITESLEHLLCWQCDYRAFSADDLAVHQKIHPLICHVCSFKAESKEEILTHYHNHHPGVRPSRNAPELLTSPVAATAQSAVSPKSLLSPGSASSSSFSPRSALTSAIKQIAPLDLTSSESGDSRPGSALKAKRMETDTPDLSKVKVKAERKMSEEEVKRSPAPSPAPNANRYVGVTFQSNYEM
jgi:hypothetical protein